MKNTGWNQKLIKKQIQICHDMDYKLEEEVLNELALNLIVPFQIETDKKADQETNISIINEYSYFMNPIKDLSKIKIGKVKGKISKLDMSVDDALTFTYDFFKNCVPEWLPLFEEVYKERNNNLNLSGNRCYEIYLPRINYSYLSLQQTHSVEDLFNIIHEYTHSIVNRINFFTDYNEGYPFIDLPSLSLELIAFDYINEYFHNTYLESTKTYVLLVYKTIISYAEKIVEYQDNYQRTNSYGHILEYISYVLPSLFTPELYYQYKEDREKWFDTIMSIIKLPSKINFLNATRELGLKPNRDTKRFLREIKRI